MAKWFFIAFVLSVAFSSTAGAQSGAKSPPADVARDGNVQETLDLANQNRPSAAPTSRPSSTLDDYAQERWKIKLQTIVPYVLLATPVILLIVLVALRVGGVRSPEHIMLAAALVLVIQATLTVSLTAEGSDALSASMGILGAIAGYLFGRSRQEPPAVQPTAGKEATHAARAESLDVVDRRAA